MNLKNNFKKCCSVRKQGGASVFGIILLLVIVGMALLSVLKVTPSYLDNNVIVNTMEGMANNNDLSTMSISQIRAQLQRSLVTNGVRDFDTSIVELTREGDDQYIDINYESRVPLFYNIEIVVLFDNRFEKN